MYSETGVSIGEKDSYQALHGVWIYLLDELDSLKRGDVTRTKNFLTAPKDHYRPSYGRVARDYFRQNVFAGTTNEASYFADRTGNRRFWPARVQGEIDIDAVVRDRDQLWAEAFERYARSERWYADTAELRAMCEKEQADRVTGDPWEQLIEQWLSEPRQRLDDDTWRATGAPIPIPPEGVLTSDVLTHAIGKRGREVSRADEMRIGEALRTLGYERQPRSTVGGVRGYRYMQVGQVGQQGRSAPNAEKKPAKPSPDLPDIPDTGAHTEKSTGFRSMKMQTEDPGRSGRSAGSFIEDLADLGIGGGA
jgi:hypothetical protein